jgi:hypothetical protein
MLVMNAFGGDPQRIIDLLERKPITAQFPIRRVRLSSTSFHGTSNSTPRKDSLVPRSAETARTLSSTGTLLAIATFRPTFLVSRAKKVWTPENQRYPAQASTKPAVPEESALPPQRGFIPTIVLVDFTQRSCPKFRCSGDLNRANLPLRRYLAGSNWLEPSRDESLGKGSPQR